VACSYSGDNLPPRFARCFPVSLSGWLILAAGQFSLNVGSMLCCIPKSLPIDQQLAAVELASECNPANRFSCGLPKPSHIALLKTSYWGAKGVNLGVSFLESVSNAFKTKVLSHANAWGKTANVKFSLSARGQVRIALTPGSGYWSYLGTDIRMVPAGQPTMNLDSFTVNTPEAEWLRVVRHEFGHTLGFTHEHLRGAIVNRIDPAKATAYFRRIAGWSAEMVRSQVLTPISEAKLSATTADLQSIMCYQLPATIMRDGKAVPGGADIDAIDRTAVAKLYPKS
jgi:hypothetical protein